MTRKILFYLVIGLFIILNILTYTNINKYINILNICFNKEIYITNFYYALICVIIALISILIIIVIKLIIFNKKEEIKGVKLKSEDGTFGTANWLNDSDIKNILGENNVPGLILGKKENNIVKLPFDSHFNKNITIFGSSGSMKTIAFIITNLLELLKHKKSIIVTDAKGEIYRKTNDIFRNSGYIVKVFNLKDMVHSDRWNPLEENEDITDIQTSSNVIITGTQKHSGKDDFWPRAEENLLKAFEFYFLESSLKDNTLTSIYKAIASGDIATIDEIFKKMPKDSPARMSYNIFASGSDTIKASVLTGLGTRLQAFQNKELQDLTSTSDIDLSLPGKKPCIYYVISSDVDSSRDFLVSLFFTFLFIKLVKYADSRIDGRCENDVFFLLDEFANIGEIPDFNKKISTVRSRGISLIIIVQNVGQIQNRYPQNSWQEIIGNCDLRLCFGASDTLTAQYFCELLGVSTAETLSLRKDASLEGEFDYGQKNISTLKRNLLNADEIIRLPYTNLLVNIRGNKPLLLEKMIYTEHELANNLKDVSVNEYSPAWTKKYTTNEIEKKSENTVEQNNTVSNDKPRKKVKKIIYVNITYQNF